VSLRYSPIDTVGARPASTARKALTRSLPLLAVTSGCALGVSFDDYEVRNGFQVGGTVEGLEGERVVLVANGVEYEASDGAFVHPVRVADGTLFTIAVQRDAPTHSCVVERGQGIVVRANVGDVSVRCTSSDPSLRSLEISGGTLVPPFSPEVTSYEAHFGGSAVDAMNARISIVPKSAAATVTIDGRSMTHGAETRTFVLDGPSKTVNLEVVAANGRERRSHRIAIFRPIPSQVFIEPDGRTALGASVALGSDVLAASHEGVVRLYSRKGRLFVRHSVIAPDDPALIPRFGDAIAMCGDTLFIGSPREQGEEGALYAFRLVSGAWTQVARIEAPVVRIRGRFGQRVACSDDAAVVSGLCSSEIGSPFPTTPSCRNSVYVLRRSATGYTFEATLEESFGRAHIGFGSALAIDGSTLVVGAPLDASKTAGVDGDALDTTFPESGAAVVYRRGPTGAWSKSAYLKASNPRPQTHFGLAVAAFGDRVAVASEDAGAAGGIGASQTDDSALRAGRAAVVPDRLREGSAAGRRRTIRSRARDDAHTPRDRLAG
jgi:hypothetical protein